METAAFIGLGANLPGPAGGPEETLRAAARALGELGLVEAGSGLWRTSPVGPVRDQPAFVNGAVVVRTGLGVREFLLGLHEIERRFGRVRGAGAVEKGPRTLDLDLLLWGPERVVDEAGLRAPHPEMRGRRFVLAPLAEFAAGVMHPTLGRTVGELLGDLPDGERVERIAGPGLLGGGEVSMFPGRAMQAGRLEVITGPMFSGKTEELIRRLRRAEIARLPVACYKPEMDARYSREAIASHSAQQLRATPVGGVGEMRVLSAGSGAAVVGVDEVQFFAPEFVELARELVRGGRRVIVAGLDMTAGGEPFGPVPALMALADEVVKLSAVCTVCGAAAVHSQRLRSAPAGTMVGGAEAYAARCRLHFWPGGDLAPAEMDRDA